MCAIVDANVAHEVFGAGRPEAGRKFFEWINDGSGRLVVGGKLFEELKKSSDGFRNLGQQLQLAGRMTIVNKSVINKRTDQLQTSCRSDDPHVIALAQVSGARLLYSNDRALQRDFKNRKLIDSPKGSVYTTLMHKGYRDSHKDLLKRDLCRP